MRKPTGWILLEAMEILILGVPLGLSFALSCAEAPFLSAIIFLIYVDNRRFLAGRGPS